MTRTSEALGDWLAKLDRLMQEKDPELHGELRPPATDQDLAALSKAVFGGRALPAEVEGWFRWHDGQEGLTPLLHEDNRTLVTCERALSIWSDAEQYPADTKQPWSRSWLPLFENGAGDSVCLETSGPSAGALIEYWHDADDRGEYFPSLVEWAKAVFEVRSRLYLPDPSGWVPVRIEWDEASFERISWPEETEIAAAPVWTTYDILCPGQLGFAEYHRTRVKVAPDKWVRADERKRATTLGDLKRSVEEIRRLDDRMRSFESDVAVLITMETAAEERRARVFRAPARATPRA